MAFKILTENGADNTNIDGARAEHFNAGLRDGIVKGAFNEGTFIAVASNVISFDTCELRISGHRVINDEIWTQTFSSSPSVATRFALIGQIEVDSSSNVDFSLFVQNANTTLVKNNLFRTENGAGTYQIEIGRFTLTTSGTIEDVVRTIDTITGGSSGMGEHFITGNITTTMLDAGMDANVTAEDIYDANGNYEQTDFSFEFPETAGTVVTVNDVEQANLSFTSDPQTQLNNKVDEVAGKGLSENDYTTTDKNKLDGIEAEANKTIVDSELSSSSENPVQNKVVKGALDTKADANNVYTKTETDTSINKRWTFSGGIKFNNETFNDGTILAIFKAPLTGTYTVKANIVKDGSSGDGGISFSVPTDPSKLENNYTSGWFPSLSGTTMKFQRNIESRFGDATFDISMNADDILLIIAGHTSSQGNIKVSYSCTITASQ